MTGRAQVALCSATASLLLAAIAHAQPSEPAAPAVTVVSAWRGAIAEQVIVSGDFVARDEVLVTPQIEGHAVTEIDSEAGDHVAQGQVLARLSQDTLQAQMAQDAAQIARARAAADQAQGAITEAQANHAEADAAFGRSRALLATGSASRETYDQKLAAAQTGAARLDAARNALLVARADLALALAQQRELQVSLDRTAIRAPVAGIVSRRAARLGAVVGQSGEALFRIIANGAVELDGLVPEAELARLRPGQSVQVTVPGRDIALAGRVRLVSPEIDATTRLGRVRVALANEGAPSIGGFGRGAIEVARHDGVLVPLSAVLFQPDGARVQVVQAGIVQTRPVTLGLQSAGVAEIARGLAAGETVVSVSGTFVRDGDRVAAVRG